MKKSAPIAKNEATDDLAAALSRITGSLQDEKSPLANPVGDGTMRGHCPTCGKFTNAAFSVEVVTEPEGPPPKMVPWRRRRHRKSIEPLKATEQLDWDEMWQKPFHKPELL